MHSKSGFVDDVDFDDGISIKENLISSILPNIYRCDVNTLYLRRQNISFDEFKQLVSNICRVDCLRVTVKDENGTIVAFEKLMESAANVQFLFWFFNDDDTSISAESVMNLLKISHFSTRKYFGLFNTPATFDLDTWFSYVKKNKSAKFNIDFSPFLPEAYQNRLEDIIDKIIATQNHEYIPPIIGYDGHDGEKYEKLRDMNYCAVV